MGDWIIYKIKYQRLIWNQYLSSLFFVFLLCLVLDNQDSLSMISVEMMFRQMILRNRILHRNSTILEIIRKPTDRDTGLIMPNIQMDQHLSIFVENQLAERPAWQVPPWFLANSLTQLCLHSNIDFTVNRSHLQRSREDGAKRIWNGWTQPTH